uniref:Uncharacterized protein n=1 Tax=Oryza glumipatula TaxID=40148 RepID=A0A0D9ZR09_9ORYZ
MMQGRKQSQHSVSRFEFADEGGFCFVAVKVGDLEEGTAAINFRAEDISLGWEGSVANIQFSWDLGGDQNTNGTAHIKFVPLELLKRICHKISCAVAWDCAWLDCRALQGQKKLPALLYEILAAAVCDV